MVARISTFIDRSSEGVSRQLDDSDFGPGAVTAIAIAARAVGTTQAGSYDISRSLGTMNNQGLPRQILGRGTVSGYLGSFSGFRNLPSPTSLASGSITRGTLALTRLPRQITARGTTSGQVGSFVSFRNVPNVSTFNAGSVTRGTISAQRLGSFSADKVYQGTVPSARQALLQNIPGTVDLALHSGGTISINKRTSGTVNETRLHAIGELSGSLNVVSKTSGTLQSTRYAGSQPLAYAASKITSGSFAAARQGPLQAVFGTLSVATKTLGTLSLPSRTSGTLPASRHPTLPNHHGSVPFSKSSGTIQATRYAGSQPIAYAASKITSGTMTPARTGPLDLVAGTVSLASKTSGSLPLTTRTMGTLMMNRHQMLPSLIGTLSATKLSGTIGTSRLNRNITGVGSMTAQVGSFTSYRNLPALTVTGTYRADLVTYGTLDRARYVQDYFARTGTFAIGSSGALPDGLNRIQVGLAWSKNGQLWIADQAGTPSPYVTRYGTLGLRSGTPSRMGTIKIGSFRPKLPDGNGINVDGMDFRPRGDLWMMQASGYAVQLGTLALRAGTNSRQGTTRIGSMGAFGVSFGYAMQFGPQGDIWHVQATGTKAWVRRIGTNALSAGTNSKRTFNAIGSFRVQNAGQFFTLVATKRGHLILGPNGANARLTKVGTLPLRGGTNSRIGTYTVGSVAAPDSNMFNAGLDTRGQLWMLTGNPQRVIRAFGTPDHFLTSTPPTFETSNTRVRPNAGILVEPRLYRQGTVAQDKFPRQFTGLGTAAGQVGYFAKWRGLGNVSSLSSQYGSVGTFVAQRARITRISTTVFTLGPGTSRRTFGTTNYPAGPNPKWVSVTAQCDPSLTQAGRWAIVQGGQGTLAACRVPAAGMTGYQFNMRALISDGTGHYRVKGTMGSVIRWVEWT